MKYHRQQMVHEVLIPIRSDIYIEIYISYVVIESEMPEKNDNRNDNIYP